MPLLENPRHELFAQELAKGTTADKSYVIAGFKEHRSNAAGLARKKHILARVAELQDERLKADTEATALAAKALSIDKQWLMEKAEDARAQAMTNGQPAAAVSAIKELGILSGFRVEKRQDVTPPRSLSEIEARILQLIGRV